MNAELVNEFALPFDLQIVNGKKSQFGGLQIKQLLVPVDFSVCTLATLQYAGALAQSFQGVIHLLHVVPVNVSRAEENAAGVALRRTMSEAAQRELAKLAEILWVGEISATITVREGRSDDVILQEAGKLGVDLIVMGKRERSWLSRLFRRQTVRHVLQQTQCPVVVVRARAGVTDEPSKLISLVSR
ncbi:MAG TPA: universal stress protein [Candidatus Acidoferrum sp.]|nr:universal stress protein [Candidatus Acidoferrum sp.]